jgi:multiple sugar transport system permease protein
MVPFQATLIPSYILVSRLDWVDSYWGLIVPTLANSQAVFLMRQFIMQLPDELFEAAEIDGASEWRIFTTIVVPLIRPVLATLGIFVFLWHWNDFLWPLVIGQSGKMQTLTVGLATLQTQAVPINQVMAGATITVVPSLLVFGLLQRYLTDSIAMSGLKA